MGTTPYILSLAYRNRIEEVCKSLSTMGLRYFVSYLVFNNGQTFVLSNMFDMLVPYYVDGHYKEDNSFRKTITANAAYYLCNKVSSVSDKLSTLLEDRFNIFRAYYIIRNCPECQFVFGAIKDNKFDDFDGVYKRTVDKFEDFCINFVDNFIDVIKYYNQSYYNSIVLNDAGYRRNIIKTNCHKTGKLTVREIESLHLAALGKTSEETAIIMGISTSTIDAYREEAKRKLAATNMPHAVFEAIKYGYIGSFNKIWNRPDAVSINGFSIVSSMEKVKEMIHNVSSFSLLNTEI